MTGIVPWGRGGNSGFAQYPLQSLVPYRLPETNLPVPDNSPNGLRDWWRELRSTVAVEAPTPVQSAVVGIRQNAESAAIGALLALIDTDLGGLDLGGRIPLDWVGSALFYAMSIQSSGKPEGLSLDYRAMGQSCTTVAMYRMVHRWRESKKGIPQNTPKLSGDPVLLASKAEF